MRIKHKPFSIIIKYIYVVFLIATGILTLYAWLKGVDMTEGTSEKTSIFMRGVTDSGYIIPWMGMFKIIAGLLIAFPKTSPFGIIAALPYSVNILLYVLFIANEDYLILGISDFIVSIYLIYAYSDYYKPMINSDKQIGANEN